MTGIITSQRYIPSDSEVNYCNVWDEILILMSGLTCLHAIISFAWIFKQVISIFLHAGIIRWDVLREWRVLGCVYLYVANMDSFLLQSGSYDLRTDGMRTFKDINPTRYSYLMGHENPYFVQGDEKRWWKQQRRPVRSKRTRKECNNEVNYKKALDQNVSGTLTLSKPNCWSQTQSIYTNGIWEILIYIYTL